MKSISKVTVDFNNVIFMSRSFADEFYKLKKSFSGDYKIEVDCINKTDDVAAVLEAVSHTQSTKLRKPINPKELYFNDFESLQGYLISL